MIEIDRLHKQFGAFTAVDELSLSVYEGDVIAFLGPNGAGKSTTFRMIAGFLTPTSGTIRIRGFDVVKQALASKQQLGYLPEGAPCYPDMTPVNFLHFVGKARGLNPRKMKERFDYVVNKVNLESVLEQRIQTLSKGFKRRVALAQAILHDPPILLLDEPTDGLDPNQKRELREFINDIAQQKAIIISTHDLNEVQIVCNRAVVMSNGQKLVDTTPDILKRETITNKSIFIQSPTADIAPILTELDGVSAVERISAISYRVYSKETSQTLNLIKEIAKNRSWLLDELHVVSPDLDEVFYHLTARPKE